MEDGFCPALADTKNRETRDWATSAERHRDGPIDRTLLHSRATVLDHDPPILARNEASNDPGTFVRVGPRAVGPQQVELSVCSGRAAPGRYSTGALTDSREPEVPSEVVPDLVVGQRLSDLDPSDVRLREHKRIRTGDVLGGLVEKLQRNLDRVLIHQPSFPERVPSRHSGSPTTLEAGADPSDRRDN